MTQAQRVERSTAALLTAAVELIAEQGYAAVTPAQISERAGYTRGMVRVRYGSKLGLLEAILTRDYQQRLFAPILDERRSGLERALGTIDELRDMLTEDSAFLRAVFMVSFESLGVVKDLGPQIRRWLDETEGAVAAALAAGQDDGSVDPTLDCRAEGRQWVTTAVGLAFRWCQDPAGYDYDAALVEWRRRSERLFRPA